MTHPQNYQESAHVIPKFTAEWGSTAGDGIRTRDSLLGRQDGPESPVARYESPWEAERTTTNEFRAALRKGDARPRQKKVNRRLRRMLHSQVALEQLSQTFCTISSETSCLLPLMASSHFCLCFDNGYGFLLFHKRGTDRSDPAESLHASVPALEFARGAQADFGEAMCLTCRRSCPRTPLRQTATPVVPR
jgi:hypothetical protein